MEPNRTARRFEHWHALREQSADQAGENVAGTRRRQSRRQVDANGGAPARLGDDRISALGDNDSAQKRRRRARARQFRR